MACDTQMWLFWLAVSLAATSSVKSIATHSDESALRTTLETGYITSVRPSTPTNVNVFFSLRTLQSLDITAQTMTVGGWIAAHWEDPRLVWNASDYANISSFDADWIWRPRFLVSNSAEDFFYGGYDNDDISFSVFNTGEVRWVLPVHWTTTCDISVAKFPFDSQSCYIEIVFVGKNGVEPDVAINFTKEIDMGAYLKNSEWRNDRSYSSSNSAFHVCCPATTYTIFQLNFDFTRLRPYYVINLIVPSITLSFCMVFVFLIPTDSGERHGFALTILLSYTVLATITTSMIPTTSKEIPYLAVYLIILIILSAASTFNVVLNVKWYYLETTPPKWLQIMASKLKPVVFFQCRKRKDQVRPVNNDVHIEESITISDRYPEKTRTTLDEESQSSSTEVEPLVTWKEVSITIDRLLLYVYSAVTFLITVFFSMAMDGSL